MTTSEKAWTAVILAGQRPGTDALAAAFGETWKALVPFCGEPMVTHVVRTLNASERFSRIIVLAQEPEVLRKAVDAGGGAELAESGAGISTSILKQIDATGDAIWPLFVTTADHPLLTVAMIDTFLRNADGAGLAVGMVERAVMQAAYPENRRTWLKFRDGHWSGANLFALGDPAAKAALTLWSAAEQDRKTAWKLFLHFGPWLAFRALTRTIGLGEGLARVGQRMGFSARLVPMPQAEAAIDVDKVSDHEQASTIFAGRG